MLKRVLIAVAALVLATPAQAASCTLAALDWMAGIWRSDEPKTLTEERWVIGPDDRLMGSSWSLHPGAGGGVVEASTIQVDAQGQIAMRLRHFSGDLDQAWEEKDQPMVFAAASCDGHRVVFDGQGSRAGEHMTYSRDGDAMSFVGDFIHSGQPIRVLATFRRVGP